MNYQHFFSPQSRRDFLKRFIVTGSMLHLTGADLLGFSAMKVNEDESPAIVFKYRTMTVDHLSQLQQDIDKVKNSGKISRHKVFRSYIKDLKFELPEKIPNYAGRLEDVTEEETRKILQGNPDKELLKSLTKKLKGFVPATKEEYFPILTRNLSVLIT